MGSCSDKNLQKAEKIEKATNKLYLTTDQTNKMMSSY